jgi:RNase P subunit RPR2
MICHRCRGFLVCETFDELRRDMDSLYTRCINCGYVEDAVVRANRVRPLVGTQATPRGRVRKRDVGHIKMHLEEYASAR